MLNGVKHLFITRNADTSLGKDYKTDSISPLRGFKGFCGYFAMNISPLRGLKSCRKPDL